MADIDMKQKIKEVRDKFLSNNQIEDIRQNITLGVEERLKFLNTEQIKVVELLEEKHKELDNELRLHAEKQNADRENIESSVNEKAEDLEKKLTNYAEQLEYQNNKTILEATELENRLKKAIKEGLNDHTSLTDTNNKKFSQELQELKKDIETNNTKLQNKLLENQSQLDALLEKNALKMERIQDDLQKSVQQKETNITDLVEKKLSIYEADKKTFHQESSKTFAETLTKLEKKIESFLENHQMVEEIIDSRLTEFRNAQKAAFEELEAALTLLERHQDDTIKRFKSKSQMGIGEHINLSTSSKKNRGSILHQPRETDNDIITTAAIEDPEFDAVRKEPDKRSFAKPVSLLMLVFFLTFGAINYFNLDYEKFLDILKNFSK
tara:strand:+ start:564 stop:1706 length:1143 start_codon:yes stop_codon:yes gene_type:complete